MFSWFFHGDLPPPCARVFRKGGWCLPPTSSAESVAYFYKHWAYAALATGRRRFFLSDVYAIPRQECYLQTLCQLYQNQELSLLPSIPT